MKKTLFVLIISLTVMSCSKGGGDNPKPEDKEAPTMVISAPVQNASIAKGGAVLLTGVFADDMELKELVISLLPPPTNKSTNGIHDPWEPNPQIVALSGNSQELIAHKAFNENVPSDCLSGLYTMVLTLKDASGKVTKNEIKINIL